MSTSMKTKSLRACDPQTLVLSDAEKRLVLAHRKLSDYHQNVVVVFTEKTAEQCPRQKRAALRLVDGGAQ